MSVSLTYYKCKLKITLYIDIISYKIVLFAGKQEIMK
jgi:hypothetical protein